GAAGAAALDRAGAVPRADIAGQRTPPTLGGRLEVCSGRAGVGTAATTATAAASATASAVVLGCFCCCFGRCRTFTCSTLLGCFLRRGDSGGIAGFDGRGPAFEIGQLAEEGLLVFLLLGDGGRCDSGSVLGCLELHFGFSASGFEHLC